MRRFTALLAAVALLFLLRAFAGGRMAIVTGALLAVAALFLLVLLPRMAHRAFRGGAFARAGLLYRFLATLRLDGGSRAALRVSLAACWLGRERYRDGLALLDAINPAALRESARAAWHNNRAYALARSGGDPAQALLDSDAAIALRPDLPGFRHTRGLALFAQGRLDEAIRELDAVWQRGGSEEAAPLLEAERCYDVGLAWSRKGQSEYAADYFDRARRTAPGSPWSERAAARLPPIDRIPDALADLIESP